MKQSIDNYIDKINKTDTCWLWTGKIHPLGYGTIYENGRNWYAHRLIYELFNRPIPRNHVIDHLCKVRNCVNPEHLEAITNRENILRGDSPAGIRARATHCQRGHAFDKDNTYISPRTKYRFCKACAKVSMTRYYAKLKKQKAH